MVPKSSFGHPGLRFLRFWEDLIEVWFLMVFGAAPKMEKIWKNLKKVICPGTVGGRGWLPEDLLECLQIQAESCRVCKASQTPCPLRAGAADLSATVSSADLRFCYYLFLCRCGLCVLGLWICVQVDLFECLCVRVRVCVCVLLCFCVCARLRVLRICLCLCLDVFV